MLTFSRLNSCTTAVFGNGETQELEGVPESPEPTPPKSCDFNGCTKHKLVISLASSSFLLTLVLGVASLFDDLPDAGNTTQTNPSSGNLAMASVLFLLVSWLLCSCSYIFSKEDQPQTSPLLEVAGDNYTQKMSYDIA